MGEGIIYIYYIPISFHFQLYPNYTHLYHYIYIYGEILYPNYTHFISTFPLWIHVQSRWLSQTQPWKSPTSNRFVFLNLHRPWQIGLGILISTKHSLLFTWPWKMWWIFPIHFLGEKLTKLSSGWKKKQIIQDSEPEAGRAADSMGGVSPKNGLRFHRENHEDNGSFIRRHGENMRMHCMNPHMFESGKWFLSADIITFCWFYLQIS